MNRMMQWFKYDHLPPDLQKVSAPCCELAKTMDAMLPEGPEKTAGLRKLLEAKDCLVRALIEKAVALLVLLLLAAGAEAQHHGQVSSSGKVYNAQIGLWHYNGVYYSRQYIQPAGYYVNSCYHLPVAYYEYTVVNYTPPASYVPPTAQPFDADEAILRILAKKQAAVDFAVKLKAAGLTIQDFQQAYPQYAQQLGQYGAYQLQGHYYNYQVPFNASTQYGYSYKDVAALYGSTDLNILYQQAAQLAAGSQKLTGEATAGFQQLVGQAGDNAVRIAEIQAKGQVAAALLKAMEGAPAAKFSGYSFKVSPGGAIEKIEDPKAVDPKAKVELQNQLAALVGAKCAGCHTGKAPKGGFDIAGYMELNPQQKMGVWARLTTDDPQKLMPRNPDGGAGKKLTPDELRLFFLN